MNNLEKTEAKVIFLSKPKRFTLEEARAMLPLVRKVTQEAVEETAPMIQELKRTDLTEEERENKSHTFQIRMNQWADEVSRFGAYAKGLWLVDFDSGNGYFCWQFDEPGLDYYHGYDSGFSGRTPIQ